MSQASKVNTSSRPPTSTPTEPEVVTGVQLMQGIGVRAAKGFWAEAWSTVIKRKTAVVALCWLGIIAFMAVYAPLLASGHPLWMTSKGGESSSPLWQSLTSLDLVLLFGTTLGGLYAFVGGARSQWAVRAGQAFGLLLVAVAIVAVASMAQSYLQGLADDAGRRAQTVAARTGKAVESVDPFVRSAAAPWVVGVLMSVVVGVGATLLPIGRAQARVIVAVLAGVLATLAVSSRWTMPLERWDYLGQEARGQISGVTYTLVPHSPLQRDSSLPRKSPMTTRSQAGAVEPGTPGADHRFIMGTDAFGSDVLSQLMHASRLSISIGVVSTAIALLIGVTLGALMGYFGGWVDLLGMRLVEIFMAVPVLFLLIVAVAVLPVELRTTYVIMGIIGCFTWTGMARFTRAEFMKLRNQDFVQAAQATGLPLSSILFKHMLPNGVAPVLVDTSFAVAAAIGVEATLSYLGLGPADSASWGKLLSSAISSEGEFKWWLAVFPGGAIFLTVLAYNLLGESLRDAIDPKLKKARV